VALKPSHLHRPGFLDQYPEACFIIAQGSKAFATVLTTRTTIPILNTLTRKKNFQRLVADFDRTKDLERNTISALYIDQPLERQFDLIVQLFPHKTKREPIGVVLGPESVVEYEALQKICKDRQMALKLVVIKESENPILALDQLAGQVKCLLAIPDSTIYNPKASHGILLTTFNQRVPLIGDSQAYVHNGAIAAVYSTPEQLAEQTVDSILTALTDNKLPFPQYPKTYSIAINHQQLHSLGISR